MHIFLFLIKILLLVNSFLLLSFIVIFKSLLLLKFLLFLNDESSSAIQVLYLVLFFKHVLSSSITLLLNLLSSSNTIKLGVITLLQYLHIVLHLLSFASKNNSFLISHIPNAILHSLFSQNTVV